MRDIMQLANLKFDLIMKFEIILWFAINEYSIIGNDRISIEEKNFSHTWVMETAYTWNIKKFEVDLK